MEAAPAPGGRSGPGGGTPASGFASAPGGAPAPGGRSDHVRLLLHALPAVAAAHGCVSVGGYGPTLPWFLALLDASPVYQRGTATEQLEFHWSPAEFALRA